MSKAVAVIGMLVLLLSNFPPADSYLVDEHADELVDDREATL